MAEQQQSGTNGTGGSRRAGRGRSIAAAVCGVLAVVLLALTIVAAWARVVVFDSSTFSDIARESISDADVQAALAADLADRVTSQFQLSEETVADLPPALDRLRPVLRSAAESLADRAFQRVLANPEIPDLVARVVTRAHNAAMRLLQGDGLPDGITVVEGDVTVNLLPLISRGLQQLGELGLSRFSDIPTLTADGDPAEQIAELSAATGRDLPEDFGQLVVYHSERLANASGTISSAQQMLVVARRAFWLLIVLTVALLVATVLLARDRLRALLLLGAGAAAAMVLARVCIHQVVDEAPGLAEKPGGRSLIEIVVGDLSSGLLRATGAVLLLAVATVAVVAWRRGWRHDDLVLFGAVAAGLAVLVLFGASLWALIGAVVVGLLVPFLVRLVAARRVAPSASAS
jgi:hypothetical protein